MADAGDNWSSVEGLQAFPGSNPNATREDVQAERLKVIDAINRGDFEDVTFNDD